MPSPPRIAQALLDRRLPLGSRISLLAADGRARRGERDLIRVAYPPASVYLSQSDYAVDRASLVFAIVEGSYATDYRNTVALDIGAHKGYYAAYAVAHGVRSVVTYEPESANLEVLEQTAAGYRKRGIRWTVRPAAIGASAGRADLHVMGGSWGHTLDPPESFSEYEVGVETVEVVALEQAIAEAAVLDTGHRLVVKINIEGAECSAVLGTPAGAWRDVSEVFVETHPWAKCGADELAAHLEQAGLSRVESAHPAVLRMRREAPARFHRRSGPT